MLQVGVYDLFHSSAVMTSSRSGLIVATLRWLFLCDYFYISDIVVCR
jgi:hypothetical protein